MAKKTINIIVLLILISLISVHCQSEYIDKKCTKYNNKGVDFANKYIQSKDSSDLKKAISNYKSAIECDESNSDYLTNLILLYIATDERNDVLIQIDKALKIRNRDGYLYALKGFVFLKNKQKDSSTYYWNLAEREYLTQIEKSTDTTVKSSFIITYVSFLTVFENKAIAIYKLDEFIAKSGASEDLISYKEYLSSENFKFIP